MKKVLLIVAGNISLALGIAGIFIPVLPTTPFFLLSAGCFLKSSDKLYRWLTGHRLFGGYIRAYVKYKAVSVRAKVLSIVTLWLVVGATAVFVTHDLWARLLLVLIAAGVTVYLLTLKVLTNRMIEDLKKDADADSE